MPRKQPGKELGEEAIRNQLFVELKPIAKRSQLYGILSWFVALALKNPDYRADAVWCLAALALAFLGLAITCRSQSHTQFTLGGTLQIAGLAWAFRLLEHAAPDPAFWIMQTCGTIVLIKAVMYVTTRAHLWSCVLVCLILGLGSFTERQIQTEGAWIALGFASPLFFSFLLSRSFLALRRRNLELHAAVREMAYKDALTGIDNRRSLLEKLAALSPGQPGFFFMVDVDDFKKINDEFGHDAGDIVLQEVAGLLSGCPLAALVGRLGGEEFGVFCAQAEAHKAEECATHLIRRMNELRQGGRRLSISIGIARMAGGAELATAMKAADAALYQAKKSGKNCFVFAEPTGSQPPVCVEEPRDESGLPPAAVPQYDDRRGQR